MVGRLERIQHPALRRLQRAERSWGGGAAPAQVLAPSMRPAIGGDGTMSATDDGQRFAIPPKVLLRLDGGG